MPQTIPFNRPALVGKEFRYVAEAVARGNLGGDGWFTRGCSEVLEKRLGIDKVLMTPSCTSALEMASLLCGLGPDTEAIMPSFTFPSTATAVVRAGACPVFVDIRPDTLNLDQDLIRQAITPRTRAVFPVHYAGVGCEMQSILAVAREYGLVVVEDAAHGVNAFYHGKALGSMGTLAAFSFHETKNYSAGQGGALCINSPEYVGRAEIIRDKGTNRQQYFRGEVDEYTWVDGGLNGTASELMCAFLYAQLEEMDSILDRRRMAYAYYTEQLTDLEAAGHLSLPVIPPECESSYHTFYVVLPDHDTRRALLEHMQRCGIHATTHYVPLHSSRMGRKLGHSRALPVTEDLSRRLLRLPLYNEITEREQREVCSQIRQFATTHRSRQQGLVKRNTAT